MTIAQQLKWVGKAALLALLLTLSVGSVAAQDGNGQHDFVISAATCADFPVTDETECDPAVGVQFTVTTEDGDPLGSCTTELLDPDSISGRCAVQVPFGITVVVTEDTSTIPSGYTPVENPQSVETPPNLSGGGVPPNVAFVNVFVDDHSDLVEQLVQLLIDALSSVLR